MKEPQNYNAADGFPQDVWLGGGCIVRSMGVLTTKLLLILEVLIDTIIKINFLYPHFILFIFHSVHLI